MRFRGAHFRSRRSTSRWAARRPSVASSGVSTGGRAGPAAAPDVPGEDLGPAEERFALFLMQYWGGPTTYSQHRGHPRLRMRHAPFQVDAAAHDAWLSHMRVAVDELGLAPEHEAQLWKYLTYAAASMINTAG